MKYKFVHLMINSHVRFSLKNLIGDNEGHKIFIVENGNFMDIHGNEVTEENFYSYLQESEVVFAHFLNGEIARIINKHAASKKIVWFSWGADIYNLGKFRDNFLQEKTKKLFYKMGLSSFQVFKNILKTFLGKFIDYLPPNRTVLKTIAKTDIIVPVILADYENLKNKYNIAAEVFQVNYINNVFFKKPSLDRSKSKKNILLGNSASFTNNHIEAIDLLSQYEFLETKIYIPLSYGRLKYGNYITKYAVEKLGNNASILKNRLPFEDYLKLYASCKSVVMNHCRQQAMGNIFLALWFETTLYLNPNADHYQDLIDKGFKLMKISNFNPNVELDKKDKEQNKELLIKWYGPTYLQDRFNKLLKKLR